MRRIAMFGTTVMLTVLAMFVTVIPAQAWPIHNWHSSGVYGVDAWGKYARSSYHGHRTVAVRVNVRDTARDGYLAGVEIRWQSGRAIDRRFVWNPYGAHTKAYARVQSYNYHHLYIRECVGVGKKKWSPRRCGHFRKYF